MASFSNNPRNRQPTKIGVKIKDTIFNQKYTMKLYSWTRLGELKRCIEGVTGINPSKQRLFLGQCEVRGKYTTLEDLLQDDSNGCIVITLRFKQELHSEPYIKPFVESLLKNTSINTIISSINKAFSIGLVPNLVKFGVSGSYFLRGHNRVDLAIFKPVDEEPYAPNNPKGYVGRFGSKSMREGVLSGEGAAREVAAFMLDGKRIHKVPETIFVEVYHPFYEDVSKSDNNAMNLQSVVPMNLSKVKDGVKYGSLQFLKQNDGECGDYSCRKYAVE